jgi:hypothetical protein
MIVNYFHIPRAIVRPAKTDSPLAIDADAELSRSIPGELFQPVAWRNSEVFQTLRAMQNQQFPHRLSLDAPKPSGTFPPEYPLGLPAPETVNHAIAPNHNALR